ncbi:MAG: hypothetical protein Q8891_17420 [Bacteroidota bacterium]|nr:hypothetical protein [Bacteroidota bacterium]
MIKTRLTVSLLLLSITIMIFAGCGKKDGSTSSDYYLRFTVSGKSFTFKGYPYASFSQDNGIYMAGIGSFQDQGVGTKNVASVLIGSLTAIKEGTYSGLIAPPGGGNTPSIFFSYIDDTGKTFGSLYDDNATNTVTVTSLTGTSIKGTFSGKIYDMLDANASPMSFEGDFYVTRVN